MNYLRPSDIHHYDDASRYPCATLNDFLTQNATSLEILNCNTCKLKKRENNAERKHTG